MPLDGKIDLYTKPDLSKPSLVGLLWLLEHPEDRRSSWRWWFDGLSNAEYLKAENYHDLTQRTSCGTAGCAMGLAAMQWGVDFQINTYHEEISEMFGISTHDSMTLFFRYGYPERDKKDIMESHVADKIRKFLAGTGG